MLDEQIQGYLRALAGRRREATRIGPFLAAFDPHSATPARNYAIPDDRATPVPEEVRALIAAFVGRGRLPRLEYLPAVAPAAEGALLSGGFVVAERLPLMTLADEAPRERPSPPGIVLRIPDGPDELRATATAQNIAYGEGEASEHDAARLRATLDAGGLVICALDGATGATVGAGLYSPPIDNVTEIAAIGVLPAYRRRGIAGALCSRLAREALAAGIAHPFLMAEGAAEARIHARVGFATTSKVLILVHPGLALA